MEHKIIEVKDVIQQIKDILVDEMQVNVTREEIPDDYSLSENGLALDSILIAELIARIEDRFRLQFDERVMNTELFDNISRLATFVVQEYLAPQSNVPESHAREATC
jgi:acyl carrier protein